MEEDGIVSLWIGTAKSEAPFNAAQEVSFSEDGDFLGSEFSRAFGIEYYYDGLKEAAYRENSSSRLDELLRGASYDAAIVNRFESIGRIDEQVNCIILLYNYRHAGPTEFKTDGLSLRYFGAVNYK
jgi:Immunity protein 22